MAEGLKTARASTKGCITRIKHFIEKNQESLSLPELECRLGILESYFKQALSYQDSIERLAPEDDTSEKARIEVEDLYASTKSKILSLMSERRPSVGDLSQVSFVVPSNAQSNLPLVKLPTFAGDYTEYTSFISTFNVLVNENSRLSSIEKFRHLQSCLIDQAKNAIGDLEITAENYKKALNCLNSRFNIKALIFEAHIAKIFELPKVSKGSAPHLRNLIDEINTNIDALKSIGSEADILDAILIYLASDRLDNETIYKWEENRSLENLPKWNDFVKVLNRRCQFLEVRSQRPGDESISKLDQKNKNNSNRKQHNGPIALITTTQSNLKCIFCKKPGHGIFKCPDFLALPVSERFNAVKTNSLCINCLSRGHSLKQCHSSKCRVCSKPHNTLLHRFTNSSKASSHNAVNTPSPANTSVTNRPNIELGNRNALISSLQSNQSNNSCENVILATALIEVQNQAGSFHIVRALLDSASQISFMTESMANKLSLKKSHFNGKVGGIGDTLTKVQFTTNTTIKSRVTGYKRDIHFWILPCITEIQPEQPINIDNWNIPSNIQLADPFFNYPQKVDVLIGAEVFFELLSVGQIKLANSLPTLQKTQLGWLISGKCGFPGTYKTFCNVVEEDSAGSEGQLKHLVEQFWSIEDIQSPNINWTEEHKSCERYFIETVSRGVDGRFIVRLPFKDSSESLGRSFDIVERRFYSLEKRLNRDHNLKQQYAAFLNEYEHLNHMEQVLPTEQSTIKCFIPHQSVIKPDSTSTRLRVVFDAGCRTSSNRSLNDVLMVGPTVQNELFDIIFRLRFHKYALTADIVKMYRQIKVDKQDSNYQCILWRENSNEELKTYRLTTLTYGTSPAPYIATRCLNYLADEYADSFPRASKVIKNDFYVDNLLSGGDSLEDITQLRREIDHILSSAQFELRKWYSNHNELLREIPEQDREKLLQVNDHEIIKTLGLLWEPKEDYFRFVLPIHMHSQRVTKRTVLADLSKLFDPLGFVNPIIVVGKIFLQELWKLKLDWDESLPASLHHQWVQFRQQLQTIDQIRIPRLVLSLNEPVTIEIHGFGDASMKCYGCCIYIRIVDAHNNISVKLLCAKSKVAPLKTRTLPELELCASLQLASLLSRIKSIVPNPIQKTYLWTDSSIVLHWLELPPSTWTIFIANRVARIQDLTKDCIWRHVNSKANPADITSRGATPNELANSCWVTGPDFLYCPENKWPQLKKVNLEKCIIGKRKTKTNLLSSARYTSDLVTECRFINDFSKLRHVFSYILRFISNLKSSVMKKPRNYGEFSAQELLDAELLMAFIIQQNGFTNEINQLLNDNEISSKCSTKHLNPWNIITQTSACSQALINIVREKFWATNLREVTTKVVRNCVHCFRYRPRLQQQIMGNLPAERVQPDRPFRKTGVDFCGPIWTRSLLRSSRRFKSYVAVFVCFCTRAVHLEVVSNLSTQAFIAALKRFSSRRGLPSHIFCDNATNFVGARNELMELRQKFFEQDFQNTIHHTCAEDNIEFRHIPPRAPHFGGIWEAAVRSAKQHLYKTFANRSFTFEELSTALAQIEAILNSRPITPLSVDPNNEEALTPGHFLIGSPLVANPAPDISHQNISYLNRWNHLQALIQHFWHRWSRDYLLELQRRHKWTTPSSNVQKDMLVLIADDNLPPQKWLLGKLVSTISGTDKRTRVVDIKTRTGIIRRPIHKIAPLPMDN